MPRKPLRDKKGRFKRMPATTRQIKGTSTRLSKSRDKQRTARKPGRQVSRSGNVYYERRVNRTDKKKKKKY